MKRTNVSPRYSVNVCRVDESEPSVIDGLALTPSEMYNLALQGKPIASNSLPVEMFNDGNKEPGFDVPIYKQRGVDISDVWEQEKDFQKKFRKGYKKYKESLDVKQQEGKE